VPIDDLLERADAAREAGRVQEAAGLYDEAIACCRADGDLAGWTRAVLGAASGYVFGAEPGKLPAQLYDVLVRTTDDAGRARVAAALARCWVYAGQASRAVQFADEAVDLAKRVDVPGLLADCLDAALAVHWGPDDLDVRVELAGRLDEVAAHVLDPDARLQAHMWGLQVACESLHIQAIHRHMRALERLGEESPRAQFFAASRRLMLDLLRGRTDTAARLVELAVAASERAGLADAWMVVESMKGYAAVQAGDRATCAVVAAECEEFATAEGVPVVSAEASFLWVAAGQPERARALVRTFHGRVLDELPRDVNWLLTLQCVLEAALGTGDAEIIERAAHLLTPYAGRAVFNAGAVMFHGVTDDTLSRAAGVLGDASTAGRLRAGALATYERIGARWWRDRLAAWHPPPFRTHPGGQVKLLPGADGLWLVGPADAAVPVRALRGFSYLRELLRRPGRSVPALDLVTGGSGAALQPGLGDVLDHQALEAYRRRLSDIERDLTEAQDWSDLGRLDALHAERDALVGELTAATGLGGRARVTGSSHERARVAATKAITAAIDRIATVDAPLGRHLQATIRTGLHCSYQPAIDDERDWILDQRPQPPK
jgi:tetratricopeptide (TPR) repeat protein